jgi:hypothetical protein
MKKIECTHPDKAIVLHNESKYHEGYGMDRDSTSYTTCLKCTVCGQTSKPVAASYSYGGSHPDINFPATYRELTGRDWYTEDDQNQLSMLRDNPELFWKYPPSNWKYLVPHVPEQWQFQEKLYQLEKERTDLMRRVKELDVEINKTLRSAKRPEIKPMRYS